MNGKYIFFKYELIKSQIKSWKMYGHDLIILKCNPDDFKVYKHDLM